MVVHDEIRKQTPNRVFESSWYVFLKEKMPDPSETVAGKRNVHEELEVLGQDRNQSKVDYK